MILVADTRTALITGATLGLAAFGPLIVALATTGARWRRRPLAAQATGVTLLIILTAACVALSVAGLRQPWVRIGFVSPGWRTPLLAVALTVPFVLVVGPWLMRLPRLLGLRGFGRGLAQLGQLPSGVLIVSIVLIGTIEEILYRGIAYSLLAEMTGPLPAIVLSSVAFALAHLPLWGVGPSLTTALSGGMFTAFYAVSGDLWANALAHVAIDVVGLVRSLSRPTGSNPH